jgi:hypothetical protein
MAFPRHVPRAILITLLTITIMLVGQKRSAADEDKRPSPSNIQLAAARKASDGGGWGSKGKDARYLI